MREIYIVGSRVVTLKGHIVYPALKRDSRCRAPIENDEFK